MSLYTDAFGPNVQAILISGSRVIRGKVPAAVRKELSAAVKAGILRHFKKDGLLPEMYYNPNNTMSATEKRKREAEYAVQCIARVMAGPEDYALARAEIESRIFGADK